jgi:outer membrane receptor for ferrienterochelin and colicin
MMEMSKKRIAMTVLLALVLAASPAAASDKPSYEMQEIIISADAIRPALPTDTVNAQVVSPGKAATVPELLRQVTGIDVQLRAASGDNQDGTVKLRGFDARRFPGSWAAATWTGTPYRWIRWRRSRLSRGRNRPPTATPTAG